MGFQERGAMQRKHLTWLGSGFSTVHAVQVQAPPAGGGGAGALSPRLEPDELDTKDVMLLARDRPDRGLDPPEVMELVRLPAGGGRPSFWRRYAFLSFHVRCSPHSKYGMWMTRQPRPSRSRCLNAVVPLIRGGPPSPVR